MPSVQVSCFRVDCKDVIKQMVSIYQDIQRKLEELIAKRAKTLSANISNKYNEIHDELKKSPPNIEELTRVREFIEN